MQRAKPFRLTLWRLGFLILAWYALVLQSVLAGPLALRQAQIDPLEHAILCLQASAPVSDTEVPPANPLHVNCDCLAHCAGNLLSGILPAAIEVVKPPRWRSAIVMRRPSEPAHAIWRAGMPARGPPAANVLSV